MLLIYLEIQGSAVFYFKSNYLWDLKTIIAWRVGCIKPCMWSTAFQGETLGVFS